MVTKMTALREFPLGKPGGGSRRVQPGTEYEIPDEHVAHHKKTGRGVPTIELVPPEDTKPAKPAAKK